jgi:hypothetical protein
MILQGSASRKNVILEHYMPETHDHSHAPHAMADVPTMSLLRLSALQRLAGAALMLTALWAAVIAVME